MTDEKNETHGEEAFPRRRQLSLPLPGLIERPPHGLSIPKRDRVFTNRNLHTGRIDWVGFDMDYTVAIYRQEAMDALSVRLTAERLVARGYPAQLQALEFDTQFPIRGLLIDKECGNILKMDRHKVVHAGFHGTKKIARDELHRLYGEEKMRPATDRYHWIDTLFALCEVTSYAAVVTALEEAGEKVDFKLLFTDVRSAIDQAHAEGAVYREVTANLPLYIERDPQLPETLHYLRSCGKSLFLLTNSPYHYTNTVMKYLLDGDENRYANWRQYFDLVVCSAKKPTWFLPKSKTGPCPFLVRTDDLKDDEPATASSDHTLNRGSVYEGGSLQHFEEHLNIESSRVLYVGDHIYGDILRSKKDSNWRTALVVQELDQEIRALEASEELRIRRRQLAEERPFFEDELRYYGAKYREIVRTDDSKNGSKLRRARAQGHITRVRGELSTLEAEYEELDARINDIFHPYFGSLLKEMNGLSIFGQQVELYADIYMRRVSSLRAYSAAHFFRSSHSLMPHEL